MAEPKTRKPRSKAPAGPSWGDDADGLNARARQVLAGITWEPGLRAPKIADRLGVSRSTVATSIARLRARGLVVFVGASLRGGYFRTGGS